MSTKYSPSTQGFYPHDIEYPALPADLVEITNERHGELLEGQSKGLRIVAGHDGFPELVDPVDLMSPEKRLAQAKAIKRAEIEQACGRALARGIKHMGCRYASDQAAQAKLLTARQMADMTQEPYPVLDLQGNAHELTTDQFTDLLKAVASHYRRATEHAYALREKLAAAQTRQAVTAIQVSFDL